MSDSIDRVFVKAIATIRALSSRTSYGSLPRPPAENRIKLYGLYKQATEGDVQGIMPRPEGYNIEDEGAKKKWDAWKKEEGLSKTQAKRSYIQCLIETMRVYASGTLEARELLSELEFLWDQIKDIDYIDDEEYVLARSAYPFNVSPSIVSNLDQSNLDQSDRYSTGTPWPLKSNYSASVSAQHRNTLEQMYSHSRRNTHVLSNDAFHPQRLSGPSRPPAVSSPLSRFTPAKFQGRHSSYINASASASASASPPSAEEFHVWQGQVNSVMNKLIKEFAYRKYAGAQYPSDEESESEYDARVILKKKVLFLLRRVGKAAFNIVKNLCLSLMTFLFIIWCVNKSVVVKQTVLKRQLHGKSSKELVINMVINTDDNKWFIRLLSIVNKLMRFV